ncbi:DUF1810 domain-containing protein [sulfur-oxidizing endosymbiont of Gigantopelta aegis]|uniref:DUF1810 domain-containing protein n=1 Tax=sulfur-oxidizing endosymbiont of Gigantopelta aegis TaxID=2794934 RepID=UPI0018DEA525|nr:DUF1810 domain-containing protein [sulfur-oxidizing endosymbiont of Gigantopelta aegis]
MNRFIEAQDPIYEMVLQELNSGQKKTHWMWFIFPQIKGLGHSSTARYYAIESISEAYKYISHPVLGKRLIECTEAVLAIEGKRTLEIFGHPDDMKLKSSMTLFTEVARDNLVFQKVLNKYFNGQHDLKTLQILNF